MADLQARLKAHGLYTGADIGMFGYGTEATVLEFQRATGMVADGYAGPKTLAALQAASPQPTPTEKRPARKPAGGIALIAILIALIALIVGAFAGGWQHLAPLLERIF